MKNLYIRKIGLLSGLLLLSINSIFSAPADDIMNKYISPQHRNELIYGDIPLKYHKALKAMHLAKTDVSYDISWCSYVKSFFTETTESKILKEISFVDQQLRYQRDILQNNRWEDWGFAAARYSAVALATIAALHFSGSLQGRCPITIQS